MMVEDQHAIKEITVQYLNLRLRNDTMSRIVATGRSTVK